MPPADGTNTALKNEEDSARPLAVRMAGYLSRASMRKGAMTVAKEFSCAEGSAGGPYRIDCLKSHLVEGNSSGVPFCARE